MKELFKTLEFKGIQQETLGKYAHPLGNKGKYEWGGSSIPLVMTKTTTLKELKKLYKGLDFDLVKLVSIKLKYDKNPMYKTIVEREEMEGKVWYIAYANELGKYACYGFGDTPEEAIKSFLKEKKAFTDYLTGKRT